MLFLKFVWKRHHSGLFLVLTLGWSVGRFLFFFFSCTLGHSGIYTRKRVYPYIQPTKHAFEPFTRMYISSPLNPSHN